MAVVVCEVHVVLVYFMLHVQVSILLNEDLDHIYVPFADSNLEGGFPMLHREA